MCDLYVAKTGENDIFFNLPRYTHEKKGFHASRAYWAVVLGN